MRPIAWKCSNILLKCVNLMLLSQRSRLVQRWLNVSPTYLVVWLYVRGVIYHYSDVLMSVMASQITGVSIVCSTVYSGADQTSKLRVTGLCHKGPVTRKTLPFDDVIMFHLFILSFSFSVPCFKGSYLAKPSDSYCKLCPVGAYQAEESQTICVQCPQGFTTSTTGSSEASMCHVQTTTTTSAATTSG